MDMMPADYKKIGVKYKNIGFFHGYYICKGGSPKFKIPNWIGKILVK